MTQPIDADIARLDDYVRGQRSEELEQDYEEQLFARALDGAAPELAFLEGLGSALRVMHARGTLDLWLTAKGVEALQSSGKRVLVFELDPENPRAPVIPADTELLVTRVPVDLDDVRSLEAEVLSDDGRVLKVMPDIAFDPAENAVYACCEAELARTAASAQRLTRVWATGASGRRLLLELRAL
ncbi:MAG: hypothetical protein QM756_01610 [Polyangiaceae bacterium]